MLGFAYGLELGFMESITSTSSICTAADLDKTSSVGTTGKSTNIDCVILPCGSSTVSDSATITPNDKNTGSKSDVLVNNPALPASNTRSLKWCSEISARARLVPDKNVGNFDFDKEVRELRSLYKHCGSTVGPFRPLKSALNELIEDSGTQKSNEW